MSFGAKLKAIRLNRGMKVKEIARRAGIETHNYYRLEKDSYKPKVSTIVKISRALECTQEETDSLLKTARDIEGLAADLCLKAEESPVLAEFLRLLTNLDEDHLNILLQVLKPFFVEVNNQILVKTDRHSLGCECPECKEGW